MDKEQVKALLDKIEKYIPVSVIEKELKMPVNTLQKVLSETEKKKRNLPVKWVKPLTEWVNFKKWITIQYLKQKVEMKDLNKLTNKIEQLNPLGYDKSNFSINTTPKEEKNSSPMPDPKKDRAGYAKWLRENS